MLKRKYRNTQLQVSALGLGCMRLPTLSAGKDDIDKQAANEMVDYALSHGINYIDTAYMYHGGQSEEFLGKALAAHDRDTYLLATKMPVWMADTPADVERIFKEQQKKLGTDYFDFYLVHSLSENNFKKCQKLKAYEFLAEEKKKGTIRRLGFSFHDTPETLTSILDTYDWDFVQIQLNYLDWDMQNAAEKYRILEKRGIPCIVMEPVRGGALSDLGEKPNAVLKSARPDMSITSWAIRFAASLPGVLTVLSGMSDMAQLKDNIGTMTNFKPITDSDREALKRAFAIYKKNVMIPCTGCRYCMDCPHGVDIPGIFKIYNSYSAGKNKFMFQDDYGRLPESARADKCVGCGKCANVCPQALHIPEKMEKMAALAKKLFAEG